MEQLNTKATIAKINGYMKKSTLNIIAIGSELNALKTQSETFTDANAKILAKAEFEIMINSELPFGKKVAQKFMKIAKDSMVMKYVDFIPPSYNAIYDNLLGKSEDFFKKMTESYILQNETGDIVMNTFLEKGGEKINLPTDDIYVLNPFATGKQIASLVKLVNNKIDGVPEVKPEVPVVIDNTPKTKVEKEGVTSINIKSDNQVKAEMTEEEEKTSAYIKALGEDKETKNDNVLPISDAKENLPAKSPSTSTKSATKEEDVPSFVNIVNVEIDAKNFPESKVAELSILMASIKSMVMDFGNDNGVSNTIKVDADTKVLQFTKLAS